MTFEQVAGFALLSAVLIVVPGPSVLFVIGRALSLGRSGVLPTVVGNSAGEYVAVLAVAFGLGGLVETSVEVYSILKLGGAIYLAWLGIGAIRSRSDVTVALRAPVAPVSAGRGLRDGFVVGALNPKTIVFFATVLPAFVDPSAGSVTLQMLALGAVFTAIALVSDSAWGFAAGTAREWFVRAPGRLETIRAAGGVIMIGLAGALALSERRR